MTTDEKLTWKVLNALGEVLSGTDRNTIEQFITKQVSVENRFCFKILFKSIHGVLIKLCKHFGDTMKRNFYKRTVLIENIGTN